LSSLAGSLLRLDRESDGEGSSCVDNAVGLAPPVSLGALVPIYDKGKCFKESEKEKTTKQRRGNKEAAKKLSIMNFLNFSSSSPPPPPKIKTPETPPFAAINGITTLAYYTKKNVQTPQVSPYTKLFGGPDFDAATFYSSFGTTLGIGEASRGGTADILLLSTQSRNGEPGSAPEKDAVKAQAFSLQVLTSLAVGGKGLAGLKPGVSPDAAAEAMVVATFPAGAGVMKTGTKFELSRPGSLAAIFNKALGGAPQDVVDSVSRSLAWLNEAASKEVMKAISTEAGDSSTSPEEALTGGARALKVAQATLGAAAGDVATDGVDGLDAFESSYGTKALIDGLVESADVPGINKKVAAKPEAKASVVGKSGSKPAEVASFAATKTRRLLAF